MRAHAWLQVFVTCGSAAKRAFLLDAFPALREDHIGDSRSTSFEPLVKRQTGGAGVHLALNSLADDKLQVSSQISLDSACTPAAWHSHIRLPAMQLMESIDIKSPQAALCACEKATVRCLAANGRLLEIGKYDILKGTPLSMRTMIRNISYEGIDLARVANDPANVDEVKTPCARSCSKPHARRKANWKASSSRGMGPAL